MGAIDAMTYKADNPFAVLSLTTNITYNFCSSSDKSTNFVAKRQYTDTPAAIIVDNLQLS